jgi:organic hydroperoxide reductase OsmC/OhrA
MPTVKAHRFPVSIEWQEGRLVTASSPGKPELEVATPPEFKDGIPGVWSPEDLLVGATAACCTVTLLAVAEREGIELHDLKVDGTWSFVTTAASASSLSSSSPPSRLPRRNARQPRAPRATRKRSASLVAPSTHRFTSS